MTQDVKKLLKISGIILFFVILIGYALFRSYDLIVGVKIKNVNIVNGEKVTTNPLLVTGNAKNANKLSLNGRDISVSQGGDFSENIALLPGYNLISIRAEDKFGHIDEEDYQLIY
ncbi:MAG: hypothetical protein V4486_01965 [Patescibacteria group bacterium]